MLGGVNMDAERKKLYVWMNPAFIDPDTAKKLPKGFPYPAHTWVTSHEEEDLCNPANGEYWYCWGGAYSKHEAEKLNEGFACLDAARGICEPYNKKDSAGLGTNYIRGRWVCHQVANRILYATKGNGIKPLEVDGANGYFWTKYFFGTYGDKSATAAERWDLIKRSVENEFNKCEEAVPSE